MWSGLLARPAEGSVTMARKNAYADDLRGTELNPSRHDGGVDERYYDDEDGYDHDAAMRAAIAEKVAAGGILGSGDVRWLLGIAGIAGSDHYDFHGALKARYDLVPKHGE